jgi:hypothetical protein
MGESTPGLGYLAARNVLIAHIRFVAAHFALLAGVTTP